MDLKNQSGSLHNLRQSWIHFWLPFAFCHTTFLRFCFVPLMKMSPNCSHNTQWLPYLGRVWCSIIVEQNTNINEPVEPMRFWPNKNASKPWVSSLFIRFLQTRDMISFRLQSIKTSTNVIFYFMICEVFFFLTILTLILFCSLLSDKNDYECMLIKFVKAFQTEQSCSARITHTCGESQVERSTFNGF